ncbi:hypothetical protein PInf_002511 [Phytophthora infestans]|nr:hypothetical protein PInf_002511 [Phytophthora infestans]
MFKFTARERQLCLDLRRRDRRVRREEAKEEAAPKKTGAPVKKKAAKEMAAKTARAPAKTRSGVAAASKEADAEAGYTEAKETEPWPGLRRGSRRQLLFLTGLPPLRYLQSFHLALQRSNDLQYKFPGYVGVAFSKTTPQKRRKRPVAPVAPACVVDGDPNMMAAGAEECTGPNSDEDSDLQEEPEEDDDASYDDDSVDDWDGD